MLIILQIEMDRFVCVCMDQLEGESEIKFFFGFQFGRKVS